MPPNGASTQFQIPPPNALYAELSFPTPQILLVTLNRPNQLNCINTQGHLELHKVWTWLDAEPSLQVGIITGAGRAFCVGADLKEWNSKDSSSLSATDTGPPSGFGGLSRRAGRKPVIAAVNGPCLGGGFEMVLNCDLVVASARTAIFALPEVKRGVIAVNGALPRLARTVGRQRAMELALTGRTLAAEEARDWGIVNRVVGGGDGEADVVAAAVEMATAIAENSPDAVAVSREGIKLGWEAVGVEGATRLLIDSWYPRLVAGENFREGLRAFVEKRRPKWRESKL